MVFNLENQFDVYDDWPGGSGCAYIETFLVTENLDSPATIGATVDGQPLFCGPYTTGGYTCTYAVTTGPIKGLNSSALGVFGVQWRFSEK